MGSEMTLRERETSERDLATVVVHPRPNGVPDNTPVASAIYQASAWSFDDIAQAEAIFAQEVGGVTHAAYGTPNHQLLENLISELAASEATVLAAGGMSALSAIMYTFLAPGAHVVAAEDLFGVTVALLRDLAGWGVDTTFVDITDNDAVESALRTETRLVLAESISNPRMRVPDLSELARIAHRHDLLLVVDNTLAGPYHCQPVRLGADLAVESVTKALNGHHDVVLGAVSGAIRSIEPLRTLIGRQGMAPSAVDAWLARRGIVTYAVRQERAAANATRLASWLSGHPFVVRVNYPGLASHPDHQRARAVLRRGFGSLLSFELDVGRPQAEAFLHALESIRLVHSLGGPSTTLSHAPSMTHRSVSAEHRAQIGLHEGFFRLSVGLEAVTDLERELARGLAAVQAAKERVAIT